MILTEEIFNECIVGLGYIPACSCICVPRIIRDYNDGQRQFQFYVNPYNLCWYTDEYWRKYNPELNNLFILNIRGFKLNTLLQ
jgi:hypothetical protein